MQATDRIRERAEAAMQALRARHIPPTPRNFELWYAFRGDENPALRTSRPKLFAGSNHEPSTIRLARTDSLRRSFPQVKKGPLPRAAIKWSVIAIKDF